MPLKSRSRFQLCLGFHYLTLCCSRSRRRTLLSLMKAGRLLHNQQQLHCRLQTAHVGHCWAGIAELLLNLTGQSWQRPLALQGLQSSTVLQGALPAFASSNQIAFQGLGGRDRAVNVIVVNKIHNLEGEKRTCIDAHSFALQSKYMTAAEHDSIPYLRPSLCLCFKLAFQAKHVKGEHLNRKGSWIFFYLINFCRSCCC